MTGELTPVLLAIPTLAATVYFGWTAVQTTLRLQAQELDEEIVKQVTEATDQSCD